MFSWIMMHDTVVYPLFEYYNAIIVSILFVQSMDSIHLDLHLYRL